MALLRICGQIELVKKRRLSDGAAVTDLASWLTFSVSNPDRIAQRESRVEKLEAVIMDLAGRLGEDIDLGHQQED